MLGRHEEFIEGLRSLTTHDDADREVQSFTRKKVLTPPPGTIEYLVSGSESLASIAAKHKSTTSELVKINKLMSTLVYPSQRLFVPTEGYLPIGYGGSQASSPRTSPKLPPPVADPARQRRISLDESKRTKKVKNRLKERRPSDIFPRRRKSVTTNQRDVRFSTRVDYVTGEKDPYVSGLLQITCNEVKFEPDVLGNDRDILKDLVRYRMSLGKAMVSANIVDQNPYSKICKPKREEEEEKHGDVSSSPGREKSSNHSPPPRTRKTGNRGAIEVRRRPSTEKASDFWDEYESKQSGISFGAIKDVENEDEENDAENSESAELMKCHNDREHDDDVTSPESPPRSPSPSPSPVPERYLLVKLGIPSRAVKERPTISSLIRRSLPVTETVTVDHCFLIPNDTVAELTVFLRVNYPDAFGKTDIESLERFDALDNLCKQPDSKNAKQFLRSLSVAELCNLPLPEMSHESSILTETHVRILREHLLASAEGRPWKLVYSSNLNGYSIGTLYRSMTNAAADMSTLLLIADMDKKVFGAMLSNSIRHSEGFYGNGETFLFTFHPVFKKFCWSGKNSYFLRGTPDNFYIGASDGVFGLWLHDDLDHGRTQRCETFDNDLLTAESEDFNIRCVEVWQFPFGLN